MIHFEIRDIDAIDVSGRSIQAPHITPEHLRRRILDVLETTVLCSMATVTPDHTAHINTAYFACSDALELFFLSYPTSRHCRNLDANPSIAITVFSSAQPWGDLGIGVQMFGRAGKVTDAGAEDAERWYGARFPLYQTWKASERADLARQYSFYRCLVNTVKLLDERTFGDAVFVHGVVHRDR